MADFSSALYLGLRHAHGTLQPWAALTTGRPAALSPPPGAGAVAVAVKIARLTGCARATLATSTLHVFFDLFEVLAGEGIGICIEAGSYPIARWGVERMAARGVPVEQFATGDSTGLARKVSTLRRAGRRPVVVVDGLCPATGRPAPLPAYLRAVRAAEGWLVIDDTQAFGILGQRSSPGLPYGSGGGGSAAWFGLRAPELIVVCSLAKGFGVPLAAVAGSAATIARYEAGSTTRQHCSAPSAAHLAAAARALALNHGEGEQLRARLARRVAHFRARLQGYGIATHGGLFPLQTPVLGARAMAVHRQLRAEGITGVLHRGDAGSPPRLSFLITAAHPRAALDHAADAIAHALSRARDDEPMREHSHGTIVELQA